MENVSFIIVMIILLSTVSFVDALAGKKPVFGVGNNWYRLPNCDNQRAAIATRHWVHNMKA